MQTGQNSIAPENSLPQLGQVRWGSVLMALISLQPRSEPKATPRFTEWGESGQYSAWQTDVPFHEQFANYLTLAHQITFRNKFLPAAPLLPQKR
jgi:hypothetical protein